MNIATANGNSPTNFNTNPYTNLTALSNLNLLNEAKLAVGEERNATFKVLNYLREIESRRLHLEEGYSSMFDFCLKFLSYDESQTHRRLSAMRLMREIPQIEPKVISGELSLTALSKAKSTFNKMAKIKAALNVCDKVEILKTLENKSIRECELELIKVCPEIVPLKSESQRLLTEDLSELKIILSKETLNKIAQLKDHFSHKSTNMTVSELFTLLVNEKIGAVENKTKCRPAKRVKFTAAPHAPEHVGITAQTNAKTISGQVSRHIPVKISREVWRTNNSQCSYVNSETLRRCNSKFKLEIDHIKPFAMGGQHSTDNLRLLCKSHNLHHALKTYGAKKMKAYAP
jgi:5-methylcytosine-specific restriction endonuclease McrA